VKEKRGKGGTGKLRIPTKPTSGFDPCDRGGSSKGTIPSNVHSPRMFQKGERKKGGEKRERHVFGMSALLAFAANLATGEGGKRGGGLGNA